MSLVLLTAAGLFARSLQHAQAIDPGFERERAVILTSGMGVMDYAPAKRVGLTETLRERLASLPGVQTVALAKRVPLSVAMQLIDLLVNDMAPGAGGEGVEVDYGAIGPGYFGALGIPLLRGRDFTGRDDLQAPRVAIVSEAFVRRFWPNVDPIGRRVHVRTAPGRPERIALQVVGVARDTKARTLGEEPRPFLFRPWRQAGEDDMTFIVRTVGDPLPLVPVVRREVQAVDPHLPLMELSPRAPRRARGSDSGDPVRVAPTGVVCYDSPHRVAAGSLPAR